jgi:integrase
VGSAYVYTSSGRVERKYVSAKSFDDVKDKLLRLQSNNEQGIPVPDRSMTVAEYMEHRLSIIKGERRLTTFHGYESVDAEAAGVLPPRSAVLGAPTDRPPSPVAQAKTRLDAAKGTHWYALYVTAATLGLRHGELLGLRWQDVNVERATLTVARAAGRLYVGPAKSDASEATIPLPKVARRVLEEHRRRQDDERAAAHQWENHDLVFPSTIGTPMEPRNLDRHFEGLRGKAEMPDNRLHDLRQTVVSLLLDLGTPPQVVQAIARHAHVDITMAIYALTNLDAMRPAPSSGRTCQCGC